MPLFLVGKYLPCMLVLSYFLLFYDRKRGKRSEVRRMVFTYLSLSFQKSTSFPSLDSILLRSLKQEELLHFSQIRATERTSFIPRYLRVGLTHRLTAAKSLQSFPSLDSFLLPFGDFPSLGWILSYFRQPSKRISFRSGPVGTWFRQQGRRPATERMSYGFTVTLSSLSKKLL